MDSHVVFQTVVLSLSLGVGILILAKKLRLSAISLLLLGGIGLGPSGLNLIQPSSLGEVLTTIVYLFVAIILFEGGLTLDYSGYKKTSRVIRRLLSIGVLTTWLSISVVIYFLFDFSLTFSLLGGSLVIVTGPTVITPLLRRIKIQKKLYQILHWEGVLNDPIGVFIAITCFEIVYFGGIAFSTFQNLLLRLVVGFGAGLFFGWLSYYFIKRRFVPEDSTNIFILAIAIFTFGLCDIIVPESGLLAVVVMGFILGIKKPSNLEGLKKFKLDLTEIFIAMLFILLSANLMLDKIADFGWNGVLLIAAVLFIARPLTIFVCSMGSNLNIKEKLFLSWIAPRGIVAASMSSLFALKLADQGYPNAWFLETFTFIVIATTVIFQGFSAGLVAKVLGVKEKVAGDWLLIGAHTFSSHLSNWLSKVKGVNTLVVDTNPKAIQSLLKDGVHAQVCNAMDTQSILDEEINIGFVLCLTDNSELNALIAQKWVKIPGIHQVYRWDGSLDNQIENEHSKMQTVWSFLPKPSIVSSELNAGDAQLIKNQKNIKEDSNLLFQAQENRIVFEEGSLLSNINLTIKRKTISLLQVIKEQHIFFLNSKEPRSLYQKVIKNLSSQYPYLRQKQLTQYLVDRETNHPTGIGEGIALPHAYDKNVRSPLCIVIKVPRGIDWKAHDKIHVKLIFLLISPAGDPDKHLFLLSQIVHLVRNEFTREKLFNSRRSGEFFKIVKEHVRTLSGE